MKKYFTPLLVALITFSVYVPVLHNGFVNWDDGDYVYNNLNIRSFDSRFFKSLFTDSFNAWHPLTIISHAMDYALWGLAPWGHHLMSILLHVVNTLLIFMMTVMLSRYIHLKKGGDDKTPFIILKTAVEASKIV